MTEMTAEVAARLRAPFKPDQVGKLPRVTCGHCSRDKQRKHCDKHRRSECRECGSYITSAHMHLDYVGHAAITDRLLAVDPSWSWEPLAIGPDGLPVRDREGGLWIRLSVAGVTRLGYGDAEGKTGPSAVKEAIGDALRNGAMRFGVGLDLWHKDGALVQDDEPAPPAAPQPPNGAQNGRQAPQQDRPAPTAEPAPEPAEDGPNPAALAIVQAACDEHGWDRKRVAEKYEAQFSEPIAALKSVPRAKAFVKLLDGATDLAAGVPVTNGAQA